MANLSQLEMNFIRETASCHITAASKLSEYAQKCNDSQIVQMFQKAADDANRAAKNLTQML
ncbi:MAG: hypothetical protein FWD01_00655 [Defluviitaleaceae bacterium]|nr:hypothetical protein [Defluviitaleaceae bacterium]